MGGIVIPIGRTIGGAWLVQFLLGPLAAEHTDVGATLLVTVWGWDEGGHWTPVLVPFWVCGVLRHVACGPRRAMCGMRRVMCGMRYAAGDVPPH